MLKNKGGAAILARMQPQMLICTNPRNLGNKIVYFCLKNFCLTKYDIAPEIKLLKIQEFRKKQDIGDFN